MLRIEKNVGGLESRSMMASLAVWGMLMERPLVRRGKSPPVTANR